MTYIDLRTGAEMFGCKSSVLCLGTFDGVHIGHQELIKQTISMRDKLKPVNPEILCGAWCFKKPPSSFLSGNLSKQLTTLEEKLEIFKRSGLDFVAVGDFQSLRDVEADTFISELLNKDCGCNGVVCGFNFTFGRNAIGNPEMLKREFGEKAKVLLPITHNDVVISSSEIRRLVSEGKTEKACDFLGRPYSISATVVGGKHLGRNLGFPTANQTVSNEKLLPLCGVYATKTLIDGVEHISVTNVGSNPTVENTSTRCETHIIDYKGELYGKTITVLFYKYLRAEQRFNSVEALVREVNKNIEETKNYFRD